MCCFLLSRLELPKRDIDGISWSMSVPRKQIINEGEVSQYYVEKDHEAIIDPEIFDQVQDELKRRCPGRNRHSGIHDFSGMIKCGQCGSWYGSKVWHSTSKYRKII